MPYILKKVKDGFKVCKKDNPKECYSNKGLPLERAKKQMKAIGISESKQGKGLLEGDAKPLTARLGGKVLLKRQIVDKFFPPSDKYTTYVEPFVGGGSIFFYKEKDDHKEIINDIDPSIYTIFKGFQKYSPQEIASEVNGNYTKKDFEKIKEFEPRTDFDKFIKTFLLSRLSYFARGKTFGKPRISSTFEGYQDRLKDATILNEDYKKVIKKYDSKNTFFYLDPPYKESQSDFYYPAINLKELQDTISKIKGKFLLSFPDIKEAKDMFKEKYNIFEIKTKYTGRRQQGGQTIPAKEILISNYEPEMKGGSKPLDQELYDKVKAEIYKKNPKHSLFRSAQIAKEYKKRGGKWDTSKKPDFGIRKWFNQKWITLNDYYHDNAIVPCGSSDTYEKYDEYPLCRPLKIAKELGKEKIGKMLEKKKGPKQLRTKEVLGTDKYNIKPTNTGSGETGFADSNSKSLKMTMTGKGEITQRSWETDEQFAERKQRVVEQEERLSKLPIVSMEAYFAPNTIAGKQLKASPPYRRMETIGTFLTQLAYYKDPEMLAKLQKAKDTVDSPGNKALKIIKGITDFFYNTPLASIVGVPGIVSKLYGPLTAGLDDAINMTSLREKISKFEENRNMFLKAEPKIRADYEKAKNDVEEWKKMTYNNYVKEQTERLNRTKGGAIPPSSILHRMQKGTYRNDGPAEKNIDNFNLIETTPTMNLYNKNNIYVVAIRGTTFSEADDVAADLLIPFDELQRAPRYKKDLETLKKWKAKYGPGEWYGVGHSLGGAILDKFLLNGLLDEGVSYNPAVSYADTQKDIKNRRIYKSGDPLYNVMGRFTKSPEVRQSTEPYDGFVNRKEHSIQQFEGGTMKKFHNQLKKAGLTHELYMKAVKKLAESSGYDPNKVEMSDDGIHKLVYHSPEGLKRFGRVGYGDYIIWSFKEAKGKVPEGYAAKKRNTFRKSHGAMSKKYNLGKYSENELAINLLW